MNSINPTNSINQMTVSVIVTTKNEEKNIANYLKSIINSINSTNSINSMNSTNSTNSINSNVEIIVVDNNSSDNTVDIAKRLANKIYNKGPERSAQRNFGVKQAKSKYILYLDADVILFENVSKKRSRGMLKKLKIKFKNFFCRTQICEKCRKDLSGEPEHGFEQLEHCGMERHKICPRCEEVLYL